MKWLQVAAGVGAWLFATALDWEAVERLIRSVQGES